MRPLFFRLDTEFIPVMRGRRTVCNNNEKRNFVRQPSDRQVGEICDSLSENEGANSG